MDSAQQGAGSDAANMLIKAMKRERTSFWGIMGVFLLLVAGVAGFLGYEMLSFAAGVKSEDFRTVGQTAKKLSDMRTDLNAAQTAQVTRDLADQEAREMMNVAIRAAREQPAKLVGDALTFAERHFLGHSLNQSTASLVAAAMPAATSADADLLAAALADWRNEAVRSEWANGNTELAELGTRLTLSPSRKAFGHVVLASIAFRKSQARGSNSAWAKGCQEAADQAEMAEKAGIRSFIKARDPQASGFNLQYWRAHCLRKNGDAATANPIFAAMVANEALASLPKVHTFRVQAYNGLGTTQIALANATTDAAEAQKLRTEAKQNLKTAGELRVSNDADASAASGITENIGFLILRGANADAGASKLVEALTHTQAIDARSLLTWNLVVQLAAATALYEEGGSPDYPKDKLKTIIFETYAKLGQQDKGTLNQMEVSGLIGPDFQQALGDANDCVQNKETCYAKHAKAYGS